MPDITRKSGRSGLDRRREPYWLALAKGCALGFRRGPDTWVARFTKRDGSKVYNALKGVTEYHDAKKAAEQWLSSLSGTAVRSVKRGTVRSALDRYLKDLRTHGRGDTADEAEGRFKLTILGDPEKGKAADPIADLSLEAATRDDFDEWRERMRLDKTGKPRQPRSINRHVRAVVAGLNRAHELGHVGKPEAWQLTKLVDDREDDGDTAVFLDPAQRAAIIGAADTYLADFLRGLGHTGARPKELTAARVSDLDINESDGSVIRLQHRKGRPAKLRTRYVVLDAEGVRFFAAKAAGKLPGALLFTQDGQAPWTNHDWARGFQAAVVIVNASAKGKARIPVANKQKGQPGASAYSFRHARISELLQIHGIDPLTVAHQTGTSVAMIEKTYLKFIPHAMREKLAAVRAGG